MGSRFRASAPLTDDWQNFRFTVADGIATVTLDPVSYTHLTLPTN